MLIFIIILLIVLVILIILFARRSKSLSTPYAVFTKDGFQGVPISKLIQSQTFYELYKVDTLNYLSTVYPTAANDLQKLTTLQLASLYNSLWFYYNCKGKYMDDDLNPLHGTTGTKWDPLPCANDIPLPFVPQGWLYNFYTYNKFNVPEIYSNSDPLVYHLRVENASSTRAGIMGTYQDRYARSSGIMWVMQRSIQRDVWYPNGLQNVKELDGKSNDNWQINVGNSSTFEYPNGWYGNLKDNQYIEVTHSPSNTGDALNQSPWWWYNVSVGSGIFLFLGKTIAVKNKIAGIFTMCGLLAETKTGSLLLEKWYNSTDPYVITWGIIGLCGYNESINQTYCDFGIQECGVACNPWPIGYSRAAGHTFKNFYNETVQYQNEVLKDPSTTPSQQAIKDAIDLAVNNKHYNLAHVSEHMLADETNFFFGTNLGLDTVQFYEDPNGNDNYVFEIIDLRIPVNAKSAAKNRDYSGFMNILHPGAKPIVNPNGTWSDPRAAGGNSYKKEAIDEYLANAFNNNWLSLRSPLDVYNEAKVSKCQGTILSTVCEDNSTAQSMYCANAYFPNQWKCLALGNEFNHDKCRLRGDDINC